MSKTFFPELYELIPASEPYSPGTEYKVSVGLEKWDDKYVPVTKVQMVFDGTISGAKSPSYPLGTEDHLKVARAVDRLVAKKMGVLNEGNQDS
jgi:hypothetical protein